ncbi:MAG: hypothetical protein CVT62_10500 [Actinobacteria bacterium HGW-Actinobacteria-2]|nr:MAG: hypothetical protein CVT62_10500 [Actinobacteria bacterium HGW-Actinobacteria-2]
MILYRYLTGPDNESFNHKISLALNNGWALAGPSTMVFDPERGRVVCGQPLVKEVVGVDYVEGVNPEQY